jgi:diguanylate cyclase (GGDEF)-like protein/PAS domain S-box-containing protein
MAGDDTDNATQPGSTDDARRARSGTPVPSAGVPQLPLTGVDAIAAAVIVCSADAVVLDLNEAAAKLLAVDRAAAVGTSLTEVRRWPGTWIRESGEQIATGGSEMARLAFSGRRASGEVVGLRRDDDGVAPLWLRIAAEPLVSPTGVLENVVLTLVDITTLKETRDALEATAAELGELLRTLPDTYLYVDEADVVRRVTGARPQGHGVPRALTADGIGETLWDSLPEDAAARMRKAAALARATGKAVTAEIAGVTPATILYDEVRHVPRDDGSLLLIVRDVTESRRAAEALRLSEEKYRTLYQRTPVMLHSIDAEGRLLSVSDRWLQRLGYTAGEVLGLPSTQFLTEESRRYARDVVLPQYFATGVCEDVPYQMVARDGSVVDVLLSATSERDSAGSVIRSLSVLVDVTEQRKALRDLAETDRALQTLLANVPGLAYRCANDHAWTMQVLSEGCAQVTGYDADELLGASEPTYADIISAEDRERVWDDIQTALALRAPWTVTYRILTKDGETRWVWERGVGVFDAAGAVLSLDGFVSDITDLRATEEALREREQMLSGLVGSLPGAAYRSELRPPWRTSFLSDGFETLAGRDPAPFVAGESLWTDIVHPEDLERITGELDRDLDAGRPDTESEYRLVKGDGEVRWVIDRAAFVPGEDGRPAEMIGLLIDVTGLHDALEAQVESERRLRTIIGNIPGMVYRSQAAAPWSDELIAGGDVSVTGYSVEELTHPDFRWDRIMHPDDIPLLEEASLGAFSSGRGATKYRIFAKDGSERWLLDRFTLLKDEDGAPVAQEGILLDVTDQHLVEQRLRDSQRELELHAAIATIFLTAPPGAMFTEVLGVVRKAMGARWGFFGYLDADGTLVAPSVDAEVWDACRVEGKPLRFPPETWGDNTWSRALLGKRTVVLEGHGVVPAGHLPVARAVATPIVHGDEAIGLFIVAERDTAFGDEDVRLLESIAASTAPVLHEWRKRRAEEAARLDAERALRESEQRYHALYDGSPVGVFALDHDLAFLDCNAAFESMFVIPDGGFHGKRITELIREEPVLQAIQTALQGTESVYEGPFETLGGRSLWLTIKAAPRRGADGGVAGVTGVVVDRTRQRDSEEKVRHLLLHDPVTGLANRSLLEDRVSQALKHAQRKRLTFALAAFRVDRFDAAEASLGLQGVDQLLETLGRRLQGVGRSEDTVAYLGAGAFTALLPGAAGPAEANAAVSGLLGAAGDPLEVEGRELFLTLSLGVALYPTDGATSAELLRNAEAAMRQSSDAGGGRWQFFHSGLNEEQADRLTLEAELHRALEGDQFFLEYQPLVAAATEEIVGVEALVRWRHPERGILPPLDFIPAAEDTGVLARIGEWVLAEACSRGRAWQRLLGKPLRMSVNIGARQLHDETLVDMVRRTLRTTGFDARSLELEITETAAMRDARHTAQILGALRAMGVRVALDDFGTGYSSLSHLVRLPISTVKIDRSFVRDLLTVPEHAAVAASVIALGHRLGLTVVAEGVETIGERGALRDEGCDVIQGFLYSQPVPAEECGALLAQGVIRR